MEFPNIVDAFVTLLTFVLLILMLCMINMGDELLMKLVMFIIRNNFHRDDCKS